METTTPCIADLNKASTDYLRLHWNNGGTSEFDMRINDISREKIKAMEREYGEAWIVKVNRYYYNNTLAPALTPYTGQKIYNFDGAAVIPCYSQQLVQLIASYQQQPFNSKKTMDSIKEIFELIYQLNGLILIWA